MKQQVFTIISIIIVWFTTCQLHSQINLDSCQAGARRNYPLIRQYDLIEQTEEFTISNAGKAYLPQLSFNIIGGIIDGLPSFNVPGSDSGSNSDFQLISTVQVNQAIWDGGWTRASKKIATARSEIEKAHVDLALYQIRERINNLYFGILLMDAQIDQQRIFLENLERNEKRVKIAIENGTAYRSDLDEIKVSSLNAEERIVELEHTKSAYGKVLSLMIGEPINEEDEFMRPQIEFEDFENHINRPELYKFDSQKELVDARAAMNRSALYPRIGILGFGTFLTPGINFGPDKIDRVLVAGLNVSWDIGGLYRNSNQKNLEEIELKNIQNQEDTFIFNTKLQLGQKEIEIQKFQQLIEKNKEVLMIRQRIREAYEVKYENGVCTMTELLDKTNEENLASQKLILQEILYLQKVYEYKYSSGN